ncbi:MAG: hypothetical protein K2G83_00295, partial [Ruminococcus sp.]|nr:hypothetical protein [Ruminococcus sp.]
MTRGEKPKNRRNNNGKRYRIRYDRIVILILVLIVFAVVVTSCVKAFFVSEEPDNSDSSQSLSSDTSGSVETNDTGQGTAPPVSADTTVSAEHTSDTSSVSATDSATSTTNALLSGYKTEIHSNDDIYKGDLVLVNAEYDYKFYEDDINPITLFDNKSDRYG